MKVCRALDYINKDKNSIITVGTFDGVHLGHRKIISRVIEESKKTGERTVIVTFSPHPQMIIKENKDDLHLLMTENEKIEIFQKLGVDVFLILPFNDFFSEMSPENFIKEVLVDSVGFRHIIIGFDHQFGHDKKGNEKLLRSLGDSYGFTVESVEPFKIDGRVVSSTKIRILVQEGKVKDAGRMLDGYFSIEGMIVHGEKLGKNLGFPTANIKIENNGKLIPKNGVYAVFITCEDSLYTGSAYIGDRPTIGDRNREIEIFIHDFSGDLYNKNIRVEFVDQIRDEKKFNSTYELAAKIKIDILKSKKIFSNIIRS